LQIVRIEFRNQETNKERKEKEQTYKIKKCEWNSHRNDESQIHDLIPHVLCSMQWRVQCLDPMNGFLGKCK
jgi:hypothetical protein